MSYIVKEKVAIKMRFYTDMDVSVCMLQNSGEVTLDLYFLYIFSPNYLNWKLITFIIRYK